MNKAAMHILSIGINHTSAPINLRERIIFGEEQIRASLSRLSCGHLSGNMAEMVILSPAIVLRSTRSQSGNFSELEIFIRDSRH